MNKHNFTHDFKLEKNGGFVLKITLEKAEIQKTHDQILAYLAKQVDMKGFRKGEVPLELAKGNIKPETVLQETLQEMLTHSYSHVLQDQGVKPIMDPQIKFLNPPMELGKDWEIECVGSQRPTVTITAGWQAKVKAIKDDNREERVKKILDLLQQEANVEIAPILLEADVQNKLYQDYQAGLLNDKKEEEVEEYKKSLFAKVQQEWALNLALEYIADENKFTVEPQEIEAVTSKPENQKVSPNLVGYLLRQQKAIDFLVTL